MSKRALSIRIPYQKLLDLVFDQFQEIAFSAVFWLTAFTLLSSLVLGGGTRPGYLGDAILQLLSIPLLLLSASRLSDLLRRDEKKRRQVRWEFLFCCAVALLPLIQLVPLPPWLWTLLPHRASTIAVFQDLHHGLPWMPISVAPNDTWLSIPALMPPLAVFFGALLLNYRERRVVSLAVIALGVVSAFLGLWQVAKGTLNSPEAVGFFANRNHFAALLYVAVLFGTVWAIDLGFSFGSWRDRKTFDSRLIVAITASFLAIIVLLAAEAMARSRAGMFLTIVSLGGAYALIFWDRRRTSSAIPANFLLAAAGTAALLAVQFALYRVLGRFDSGLVDVARTQITLNTIEAARAYMPFGSGLGTFVPVYPMFEKLNDLFADRYVNHAHDDIIEFVLEAGVFAIVLMGAFVAWLVSRSAKIWRRWAVGVTDFDCSLARAATIAIVLLIAHSFVDYPLRSAAMMGIFAFACGLLVEPLTVDDRRRERPKRISSAAMSDRVPQRLSAVASPTAPMSAATGSADPPRVPVARWGEDIEWPEAWRKPFARQNVSSDKTRPAPVEAEEK